MKQRSLLKSMAAAGLTVAFCAESWAQSFEPIDGAFDIDNAIVIPPQEPVVAASPLTANLGPAVTNVTPETNPLPPHNTGVAAAAPSTTEAPIPVGSFESVNLSNPAATTPIYTQAQLNQSRQLALQEQQLKRIERVEQGLNKLVKKQSFSKSIMGTILSAAATADPVFAVVGGLAGLLLGKAEDYKEAEIKNEEIRQGILGNPSPFYTKEELRLAAYAGTPLDPALLLPEQAELYANFVYEARTRSKYNGTLPGGVVPGVEAPSGPQFATVSLHSQVANPVNAAEICSGHLQAAREGRSANAGGLQNASVTSQGGNRQSISHYDRRTLAKLCFYSLR